MGGAMKVDPEPTIGGAGVPGSFAEPESADHFDTLGIPLPGPSGTGEPAFVNIFQQLINGLPEQIALVDDNWDILAVNLAWTATAVMYDYATLQPGTNYLDFCRARAAEGHKPAGLAVEGIEQMVRSGGNRFSYVYHGRDRWEGHSFQLCVNRLEIDGQRLAMVTRYDVTELVALRQMREGFTQSLLDSQADERRRMAREIHDSTMQSLAALGLGLGQLRRAKRPYPMLDIIDEMEQLLGEAQKEIRSLSYLAHPPLLTKLGLAHAVQALVDGFGRRTGLATTVHIDPHTMSNSKAGEAALYRFVQEALSNVHRHAHATQASVGLFSRKSTIHAVVADNGVGMPGDAKFGVGVPSMRSRLVEMGGRMAVRQAHPGTILIASLPNHPETRAVGDLTLHT